MYRAQRSGASRIISTDRLNSAANLTAAAGLRSRYPARADKYSACASGANSMGFFMKDRLGLLADLCPGNCFRSPRSQLLDSPRNLLLPGRLNVLVLNQVQTLHQGTGQFGPLLQWKCQGFLQ